MAGGDGHTENPAYEMGIARVSPEASYTKGVSFAANDGVGVEAAAKQARDESNIDNRPSEGVQARPRRLTLQRSLSVAADLVAGTGLGAETANVTWGDAVRHTGRLLWVAVVPSAAASLLAFLISLLAWTGAYDCDLCAGYYNQPLAVYYTMAIAVVILTVQPAVQGGALVGAGFLLTGVSWRDIFRALALPHTLVVTAATVLFYGTYQWLGVDMWFVGHQLFAYVLFFLSSVLVAHVTWRFVKLQGTLIIGTPRGSPGRTPPGSAEDSDGEEKAAPPRRCCELRTRGRYMRAIVVATVSMGAAVYVLVRLLRYYRAFDSDLARAATRLVGFPLLKVGATIIVNDQAREAGNLIKAPPAAANLYVVAVITFVATFGRLLVLTLTDATTAIVVAFFAAFVEIVVRGTHHARTVAWLTRCGRRKDGEDRVRAFFSNKRNRDAHADYASQSLLIEISSTIIASSMYIFYYPHRLLFDMSYDPNGAAPDVAEVLVVTGAQVVFEVLAAVAGVWLEGRQNFDLPRAWSTRIQPFLALHVLFALEVVMFMTTTVFVRPVRSLCNAEFDICECSHAPLHADRCGVT